MYQLTTPRHRFILPKAVSADELEWALISYEQNGKIVLEKDLASLTIEGQVLSIRLTQEETALFDEKTPAWVADEIPEGAAASSTTPKMDGTAAVGTENAFQTILLRLTARIRLKHIFLIHLTG